MLHLNKSIQEKLIIKCTNHVSVFNTIDSLIQRSDFIVRLTLMSQTAYTVSPTVLHGSNIMIHIRCVPQTFT